MTTAYENNISLKSRLMTAPRGITVYVRSDFKISKQNKQLARERGIIITKI